jgi:hypothetical protein
VRVRSTRLFSVGSGRGVLTPSPPPVPSYRIVRSTGDRRIVRGGDPRIVRA